MNDHADVAAAQPGVARPRLDRTVLLGNVIAGAVWLAVPALSGSWILALVAMAYVVPASVFQAVIYGRESLSVRQELLAWVAPWLAGVAICTWLVSGSGGEGSTLLSLWFGLVLGTVGYLAWQFLALAVRQFLTWRAGAAPDRSCP
ncbi:hypothetical protein [Nocardioides insulae]|uniref:hypothetical protein n=1 Tax=Nocardioides insulae TaxID=394734 RepID=UPI0012FCFD16|nr:hypothetical protein [Nocardioides insulae]